MELYLARESLLLLAGCCFLGFSVGLLESFMLCSGIIRMSDVFFLFYIYFLSSSRLQG